MTLPTALPRRLWTTTRSRRLLIPLMVFVLLTLACSAADLVQRERATPTPAPSVPTLIATFTPSPAPEQPETQIIVTPPGPDRPGVIIVPPGTDPQAVLPILPTWTPTPAPTATSSPTATAIPLLPEAQPESPLEPGFPPDPPQEADAPPPSQPDDLLPIPTNTPMPTPTPTPYIMVTSGLVTLRTGPGLAYPLLAQLGPDLPVAIIGRSDDGEWLELCCVSGQTVWVVASHVAIFNDTESVQVSFSNPPPEPSPTPTPTETATVTPTPTATPYPFERAIGPQFFPTGNEYLTIWIKLFVGTPPLEQPAAGHYVTVLFEGFERPNAGGLVASGDVFQFSAPPGFGNRVSYNLKYEYYPPDPATLGTDAVRVQLIGTGTWTIYVSDGSGAQLSEPVTFTTAPSNPNREIHIGWVRLR